MEYYMLKTDHVPVTTNQLSPSLIGGVALKYDAKWRCELMENACTSFQRIGNKVVPEASIHVDKCLFGGTSVFEYSFTRESNPAKRH